MQILIDVSPRELAESLARIGLVDARHGDCDDADDCDCACDCEDDEDIPPLTFNVTFDPNKDKDLADAIRKVFGIK